MVDWYAGYNKLKIFNRCCYTHIKRYFIEAIPKGHQKISPIQQSRECSTVTNRLSMNAVTEKIYNRRQRDQKTVVETFLSWINNAPTTRGTRFDRAITYAKIKVHI